LKEKKKKLRRQSSKQTFEDKIQEKDKSTPTRKQKPIKKKKKLTLFNESLC
jgi:hypothetical protein